ncbi:MAG: hypothetical protein SGARI_002635 [Bacillariaceae sp.]
MPGKIEEEEDNDDGFWQVAFMNDNAVVGCERDLSDDDDKDTEKDSSAVGKATTYNFKDMSISLRELPAEDGILSPVGADAWYASALLTSLILQDSDNDKRIIHSELPNRPLRVLELGSGTKALPGFAAAIALAKERFPSWTVTLTDNDMDCLRQLKSNVQVNRSKILHDNTFINVECLDWGDNFESNPTSKDLLKTNVVIGSELVYTNETARALVNVFTALFAHNDNIDIWIVQVMDRSGWQEIVLPFVGAREDVTVETIPMPWDVHEMASSMIPMGGALDRHAFGAYRFSKRGLEQT